MMCYDGYFINCCPNKHAKRFEIVSILIQTSMKHKLFKLQILMSFQMDFSSSEAYTTSTYGTEWSIDLRYTKRPSNDQHQCAACGYKYETYQCGCCCDR
jgi:hypothetical protein